MRPMSSGSALSKACCASRARTSRARRPKRRCPPRSRTGSRTRPLYTARDAAPDARISRASRPSSAAAGPRARGRPAGTYASGTTGRIRRAPTRPCSRDLENGVTSVWLAVGEAGVAGRRASATALDGVYLDLAPVVLDAGAEFEPRPPGSCCGCTTSAASPARPRAATSAPTRWATRPAPAGTTTCGHRPRPPSWPGCATDEYPGLRALTVDALPYHEAGGSAAQELGCSLATGVAYLRELTEAGLTRRSGLRGSWSSGTRRPPTSS